MKFQHLQQWEKRAAYEEYGKPLPASVRGADWEWTDVDEDGRAVDYHTGVSALRAFKERENST